MAFWLKKTRQNAAYLAKSRHLIKITVFMISVIFYCPYRSENLSVGRRNQPIIELHDVLVVRI